MKENVDYKLIDFTQSDENSENDHWVVEVLNGPFEGVKLQYGTIRLDEETDLLHFDYHIVENTIQDLTEDNLELIEVVKEILTNVLSGAIELLEHEHKE